MDTDSRITQPVRCKYCYSTVVVRNGRRENNTQYWLCTNCGHGFVDNRALPGMKYPIEALASAVSQFYSGARLGDICRYVKQQTNVKPSYSTIYCWIKRATELTEEATKTCRPATSNRWIAYETGIYLSGKKYRVLEIMDSETRFLLAAKLSGNRNKNDIKDLLDLSITLTGKLPELVTLNVWKGYAERLESAYGFKILFFKDRSATRSENRDSPESLNNGQKEKLAVLRGLKKAGTAKSVLEGWTIHYNYFRPHKTLDGRTPAETAHIHFPFRNWLDVIENRMPLGPQSVDRNPNSPQDASPVRKPYRKRTAKKLIC
jgi:putative transposase